ncbi:4Fe-4S dicluster domain-containing protein [Bacilliculturomica massiliensis]|uniref:4Fe-4S dicluster domain-containing protein n=1 Tax=Bacilliculturomica massiliensis TaxID=1917867 RepID=UPI001031F845|nr:4Fe-4S dicluster domain-containing protein [Bacilliculturomica massiliensis]
MNLLELVEKAGVTGCGGAGFPTHIKWNAKADWFIVNAVECEPLLQTDQYLMRNRADDIVYACRQAAEMIGAQNAVIAVKRAYGKEIAALEKAVETAGAAVRIHRMDSFYPAGDEQVIVYEVTGKTVPCGGIPLDVGVVVSNVATLAAAFDAMKEEPFIMKYITVAGAVNSPAVIRAPLGTSVSECVEAAGGAAADDCFVVSGGPMMGKKIACDAVSGRVTKTTSGILVLPKGGFMEEYKGDMDLEALKKRARSACIQCSYCTMLCPRHLLGHPLEPHRIMRAAAFSEDLDQLLESDGPVRNASLCSLCGVCTAYACPMGLEPSKLNAFLKEEMARRGIRRSGKETTVPLPDREWRKVPTGRISRRVGTADYGGTKEDALIEIRPEEVAIALRQGPGVLPQPVVAAGDRVSPGTLIASIPAGALGSNLHASIEGTVVEVSDVIRIRG